MVAIQDPSLMTDTEPATDALLRRYDFALTADHRAMLGAYRARVRRARWWGVIGALLAGAEGLLGPTDQFYARILIGYLVGSTLAELFSPRRRASGPVHAASLTTRQPGLLLPLWARALPWVALVPCLATPLLLLGDHPTGVTHVHDRLGSGFATAYWFSTGDLLSIAMLAAAALVCWRLTLLNLARRGLPADSPEAARLDLLTRAFSARSVSGTAAALGLCLLAGLASLSAQPLNSQVCTYVGPGGCQSLYAWRHWYGTFENLGLLAVLLALGVFWLSRLPRVDAATLRSATETPR